MLPDTRMQGDARYFPRDTDVTVQRWCASASTSIEALARQVGIPRVNLSLMLKGVDPVPPSVERKLRSMIR